MPRQFGSKATSALARSSSVASRDLQARTAWVFVSRKRSQASSPASNLSSPSSELPYSPVSWRGCQGRRSISANYRCHRTGAVEPSRARGGEQLIEAQNTHCTSWHHPRFHGADLQRRARGRDARQQLYRQRLHQQSRSNLCKDTSAFMGVVLHAVDALGIVHAGLLRVQALLLLNRPGFSGGHLV